MARFSSVFVLGVAHCGSTLLGRLLNGHSDVLCVGELMRLGPALEEGLPCGCGAALHECTFWKPRLESLLAETGGDWERFEASTFAELARTAGAQTVVDLSKTLVWRRARKWKRADEGYVLLLRDSRGVLASTARVGKDLRRPIAKHVKWTKRLHRFAEAQGERALTVRYEDLCAQPEAELRRLCEFMGIEFQDAMLRPADQEHHFVHSSRSPYLARSNEIHVDQRWRRELPDAAREQIERAMHRLPLLEETYLAGEASC